MRNLLGRYVNRYEKKHRDFRHYAMIVAVLALVVFVGVNWRLHDKGISMTSDYQCGLKEHKHTADCYKKVLICGKEETDGSEGHTHTDACYKEEKKLTCDKEEHTHDADCYDEEGNLICDKEEHTHSKDCYTTEKKLICGKEESKPVKAHHHTDDCYKKELVCGLKEHTHTASCYSDESADIENKSDWEATIPVLSGNWAEDVVSIAQSQLGYEESTANFKLADDGETRKGYTRYGAWYGNKYGDWSAMFASFCLNYAEIPSKTVPVNSGSTAWITKLKQQKLYKAAANYNPTAGDLVFLDTDSDGRADHVGIITKTKTASFTAVVGDSNDAVEENTYKRSSDAIIGYCALPENPKQKTDAESTTAAKASEEKTTEESAGESTKTKSSAKTENKTETAETGSSIEQKLSDGSGSSLMKSAKKKVNSKSAKRAAATQNAAEGMRTASYANFSPYVTSMGGTGTKYDKNTGNYETNLKTNFTISKKQIKSDNYSYELKYPEGIIVPDELLNNEYRLLDEQQQQAGTYSFVKNTDGTYSVRVVFDQSYVNNAGDTINGNIWFNGKLSSTKVDEQGNIVIAGQDKVDLNIPSRDITYPDDETDKYNIDVSKEGSVIEGGKLKYTVKINSTKGTPDKIDFTDIINVKNMSLGTPEVSVKKQPVKWYSQHWQAVDSSKEESVTVNPTYDANTGKLTMELPQLTAKKQNDYIDCFQYVVTYTYDITGMDVASTKAGNTVNVKSYDQKTDTTVKDTASTNIDVNNPYTISKSGKIADGKKIEWKITVNDKKANIAGAVLSDPNFANGTDLQISPNNGYEYEYNEQGKIKDIKFKEVSDGQNTQKYKITYYTSYEPSWSRQTISNTATFKPGTGKDITGTGEVTVPGGRVSKEVDKVTEKTDGTASVKWNITVNVPNGTIPCNNKGQQVYIKDNMDSTDNTLKDSHYMTVEQIKSWNGKMQWDNGTSFDISANGQATVKFKAIEDGKYYTLEDIRNGSVSSDKKFVKMKIKLLKDLVAPEGSTVLTYSYETTADLSNAVPGENKYNNEVTVDQKVLTATYSYDNKHTVSKTAAKLDNNEIKWTITVNANQVNIAGGVLKDDMFKAITDLTKFTISPDDKQSYDIIKETTNGKETIKEIQFKSVKDKDGKDTHKNTNTYTITYYTPYEKKWDKQDITNKASFKPVTGKEIETSKTVTIPGCSFEKTQGTVDKSEDNKTATINWTVGIDIPDAGFPAGTVIKDDMTKNTSNNPGSLQYMTADQIKAWGGQVKWDNNSSFNIFDSSWSEKVTFYDINNKEYTYEDIQNVTNGVTDTTKFTKFEIKLKQDLTKPSNATKITYSYATTVDLFNVSMGENKYYNSAWVGDKGVDATYKYDKGKVVKKDGNGNTGTTNTSSENELTWKIEVTTGSDEYNTINVTDSLPEGLKLKEISIIDNNGRKVDSLTADSSGNIKGQNDTYKVTGTYAEKSVDSKRDKINLNLSYVDTSKKIPPNTTYTVTVVCETKDSSQYKNNETYTFSNDANVTFDDKEIGSSSQTQNWTKKKNTVEHKVVDKTGTWDGNSHQADYSIVLNPDGKDVVEGVDVLTLTDVLDSVDHPYHATSKDGTNVDYSKITFTVELIPTTVKLYYAIANSDGSYGKGSNPQQVQGYKWTYTKGPKQYNDGVTSHTLTLTNVPDSTPLVLEYRYSVKRDAPANVAEAQVKFNNTATLSGEGNNSSSSDKTEMWKESATGGDVSTEKAYTIYKVEEGNYGKLLQGAIFKLQKSTAEGNYSDVNPEKTFTTDNDGKIQIKWDASLYQSNTLYRLIEKTPPAGYKLPSNTNTDIYFYFSKADGTANNLPDTIPSKAVDLTKKAATIYVENESKNTSISIKKNWKDSEGKTISAPVDEIKVDLYRQSSTVKPGEAGRDGNGTVTIKTNTTKVGTVDLTYPIGTKITYRLSYKWSNYNSSSVIATKNGENLDVQVTTEERTGDYQWRHNDITFTVGATNNINFNSFDPTSDWEGKVTSVVEPQEDSKPQEEVVGSYTITANERWQKIIEDLPLTGEKNGKKVYYTYYIKEQNESAYKKVEYSNNDGITSGIITLSNTISEAYTLPETGGSGTLPFIAGGASLMGFALLCGYSIRRRRGRRVE